MVEIDYEGHKAYLLENGDIIARCIDCGKWVKCNKAIFGDLHICSNNS